jgi:hypothetical protein
MQANLRAAKSRIYIGRPTGEAVHIGAQWPELGDADD